MFRGAKARVHGIIAMFLIPLLATHAIADNLPKNTPDFPVNVKHTIAGLRRQ
jgi:hypothetical protein